MRCIRDIVGSHIAERWAIVKDKEVYQKMEYVMISTLGALHYSQMQLLMLLKALFEDEGNKHLSLDTYK